MKRMHVFAPLALCGAVCGALCASPAAAQDYATLGASLFGELIIDGGEEDGAGDFNGEIDFRRSRLCYYLEIEDVDGVTSVAIHEGGQRDNGAEVLALTLPEANGDEVCMAADMALMRTISEAPDGYYLLVRSTDHPNGAIRGQLHD